MTGASRLASPSPFRPAGLEDHPWFLMAIDQTDGEDPLRAGDRILIVIITLRLFLLLRMTGDRDGVVVGSVP